MLPLLLRSTIVCLELPLYEHCKWVCCSCHILQNMYRHFLYIIDICFFFILMQLLLLLILTMFFQLFQLLCMWIFCILYRLSRFYLLSYQYFPVEEHFFNLFLAALLYSCLKHNGRIVTEKIQIIHKQSERPSSCTPFTGIFAN